MSIYASASEIDRLRIREAMLLEADSLLEGIYPEGAERRAAAREMVDSALAKETDESIDAQQPAIQRIRSARLAEVSNAG